MYTCDSQNYFVVRYEFEVSIGNRLLRKRIDSQGWSQENYGNLYPVETKNDYTPISHLVHECTL